MKKDIIKELWEVIDTLNMYEKGLHTLKEYINDYISDIRYSKNRISNIIIKIEMEDKENG